jgi:enoyl-CoA hydratase/carnithine racemase
VTSKSGTKECKITDISPTAGADLKDAEESLKDLSSALTSMRKPIIAAVAGSALGGGFELAMMCDAIYAAEDAKFGLLLFLNSLSPRITDNWHFPGLPELTLGTILGIGENRRITLALEKARAMDLIQISSSVLSGTQLYNLGLVARVFPLDKLLPAALALATKIAVRNAPVVQFARRGGLNGKFSSWIKTDGWYLELGANVHCSWANDFRCGVNTVCSHLRAGLEEWREGKTRLKTNKYHIRKRNAQKWLHWNATTIYWLNPTFMKIPDPILATNP